MKLLFTEHVLPELKDDPQDNGRRLAEVWRKFEASSFVTEMDQKVKEFGQKDAEEALQPLVDASRAFFGHLPMVSFSMSSCGQQAARVSK